MPRTFAGDSRTWWLHGRAVVENATTGDNLSNVLVTPQGVTNGVALEARSAVSGEIMPLTTNARGETSGAYYLPAPQATLVAAGGDPVVTTTTEMMNLVEQFNLFDSRLDDLEANGGGGGTAPPPDLTGYATDAELAAAIADLTAADVGAQPAGNYAPAGSYATTAQLTELAGKTLDISTAIDSQTYAGNDSGLAAAVAAAQQAHGYAFVIGPAQP